MRKSVLPFGKGYDRKWKVASIYVSVGEVRGDPQELVFLVRD